MGILFYITKNSEYSDFSTVSTTKEVGRGCLTFIEKTVSTAKGVGGSIKNVHNYT